MARTAVICGSSFTETGTLALGKPNSIETEYGKVDYFTQEESIVIPRHGIGKFIAPHMINYRANIRAISELGAERIISFNSSGSLSQTLEIGTIVIPDDVFCPWRRDTFFREGAGVFKIPKISIDLTEKIADLVSHFDFPLHKGGVYCQTLGPTFETRAEVKFLASIGLLVGMTFAQEVFLASEVDIPIASICMVDNFANGIFDSPLIMEKVLTHKEANRAKLERILHEVINGKIWE